MKFSKTKIGLIALLLTVTVIYFLNEDTLPPRTPRKIARVISGLDISRQTELEKPIDVWTPNGDGEVLVKGKLTDNELNELVQNAKEKKFRTLPISIDSGPAIIPDDMLNRANGFYQLEIDEVDPRSYNLTIIDFAKRELITYSSVL